MELCWQCLCMPVYQRDHVTPFFLRWHTWKHFHCQTLKVVLISIKYPKRHLHTHTPHITAPLSVAFQWFRASSPVATSVKLWSSHIWHLSSTRSTQTHAERMSLLCLSCRHILTFWFRQTETNPLGHRHTSLIRSLAPYLHTFLFLDPLLLHVEGMEGRRGRRLDRWRRVIHTDTQSVSGLLLREWCDGEGEKEGEKKTS